ALRALRGVAPAGALALRPGARRHPAESPAYVEPRDAGAAPPDPGLYALGGDGRHRRRAGGRDEPVRRSRFDLLRPVRRSPDHAHPGRGRLALRRHHRHGDLSHRARSAFRPQSAILAVLARPAAGRHRIDRDRRQLPSPSPASCRRARMASGMSAAALEAVALHKRFGALVVTADVSLTLPVGTRHALIGPNGAGKTTLINLLTGRLAPSSGVIRLAGEDITHMKPA